MVDIAFVRCQSCKMQDKSIDFLQDLRFS